MTGYGLSAHTTIYRMELPRPIRTWMGSRVSRRSSASAPPPSGWWTERAASPITDDRFFRPWPPPSQPRWGFSGENRCGRTDSCCARPLHRAVSAGIASGGCSDVSAGCFFSNDLRMVLLPTAMKLEPTQEKPSQWIPCFDRCSRWRAHCNGGQKAHAAKSGLSDDMVVRRNRIRMSSQADREIFE